MIDNKVIIVENLSKVYALRNPQVQSNESLSTELVALNNVSFEIKKGESIGIIGPNGSGKSTLLRILAGITKPTSGKVIIKGKVASILDVGSGFHLELSGRENVFLNGQIHGFRKEEIAAKFDQIVNFSGIQRFIDEPVKNYSNGMFLRLAFSVLVHLDFDVYLFDEILSVGDEEFRLKSSEKINELIVKKNKTFLFISHDMKEIAHSCKDAFFLKSGTISSKLTIDEVLFAYTNKIKLSDTELPTYLSSLKVEVLNQMNENQTEFLNTDSFIIQIHNQFKPANDHINIGLKIYDLLSNVVLSTSPILSQNQQQTINFSKHHFFRVEIPPFLFNEGIFQISIVYFDDSNFINELQNRSYFKVSLSKLFKREFDLGDEGPFLPFLNWSIK